MIEHIRSPDSSESLFSCSVCGGAEASLPSECPGFRMPADLEDAVQSARLDYRDGRWYTPRWLLIHEKWGVFLGHHNGHAGLWGDEASYEVTCAPTFETREEARQYALDWYVSTPEEPLDEDDIAAFYFPVVEADLPGYFASEAACRRARAPVWSNS